MTDIRILPAAEPRVETGPVQFGDDWPGTFIRGDNCAHYALHLQLLLDSIKLDPVAGMRQFTDEIGLAVLRGLLDDLKQSNLLWRRNSGRR